jgi:hypothetical protein
MPVRLVDVSFCRDGPSGLNNRDRSVLFFIAWLDNAGYGEDRSYASCRLVGLVGVVAIAVAQ